VFALILYTTAILDAAYALFLWYADKDWHWMAFCSLWSLQLLIATKEYIMFDPTINRVPFGLLSPGEQAILKSWPHGIDVVFTRCGTASTCLDPMWSEDTVYRGKAISESYWYNVYGSYVGSAYSTASKANACQDQERSALLRIDNNNGVYTASIEHAV